MDKTLYFLRHATAELRQVGLADQPRQLIDKGVRQAEKVAAMLLRQQLVPELVLCSPYPRAVQTAQIVCDHAALPAMEQQDWLAIDTPTEIALNALLQRLPTFPTQTLLVGHEPDLSHLIGQLLGTSAASLRIKKASLCCLTFNSERRQAQLQWLLPVGLM